MKNKDDRNAPEDLTPGGLPDSPRRERKLPVRGLWLLRGDSQRSRGS